MTNLGLDELHDLANAMLRDTADGEPLEKLDRALIELGLAASVTSLDPGAIDTAIESAREAGATSAQLQEIISLVSGLGAHSLMMTAVRVTKAYGIDSTPLTPDQQALWDKHVGDDPFWTAFERELPGFLRAMLLLSPAQFAAFFDYCAVPWKSGQVRARIKELAAMASDATPTHRFLPGFRLHLANAVALGAGATAIRETLAIAAAAARHVGTR